MIRKVTFEFQERDNFQHEPVEGFFHADPGQIWVPYKDKQAGIRFEIAGTREVEHPGLDFKEKYIYRMEIQKVIFEGDKAVRIHGTGLTSEGDFDEVFKRAIALMDCLSKEDIANLYGTKR